MQTSLNLWTTNNNSNKTGDIMSKPVSIAGWLATLPGILIVFCLTLSQAAIAQCNPDGNIEFICGPISPEDLVPLPESSWVLVASWEDDGYLSAAHAGSRDTVRLFPGPGSRSRQDNTRFGQCPSPVQGGFRPHGMTLRESPTGADRLYVVRHGAREAIEIFEVDRVDNQPRLTWIGCVIAPDSVNMNSVVALPGSGFGVTSPATGDLWEWVPENGWSRVAGSENIGPNGLEISSDGDWYYVAAYSDQSILRLSRGQTPIVKESLATVGFNIDNIHWSANGEILAAGHRAVSGNRIGECIRRISCEGITSHVAIVNIETGEWDEIFNYPSNDNLRVGTTAIEVDNEIWIGSVAGSTRIAVIEAPR